MTAELRPFVIAIDGPSASGKGTLARRLAAHYNLAYLDTGMLYRAVGLKLLRRGEDPADAGAAAEAARAVGLADLDAAELRDEAVGRAASIVATIPAVREALLALQRRFATEPPPGPRGRAAGAVIDGRDIGTVVLPHASVKLFVTATPEERARRRHRELLERGCKSIYARVLQDMMERDARDSGRAISPLRPAPDALVIDSSAMDADAAFAEALAFIASKGFRSSGP